MSMNEDAISRRDAIHSLASLPVEYCGLSLFAPVLLRPIDEILIQCAAGVTACWHLRKGKDLAFVFDTVSRYVPTLQEIVTTGSTTQRKDAADLLVQCLLLKSTLAKHITSNNDAISYALSAEEYAKVAENALFQIVALRMQAAAYSHAGNWELALTVAEKAESLLKTGSKATKGVPIPPLAHSYVYAGLATYQSYKGKKQEAFDSLKKAHATFFAQPANEPVPTWVHHSMANLVLNDGMTHFHLGMGKEALDSFKQVAESYANSEVIRVEATINQVMAEANRDDQPRDMKVCVDLWTKGIQGAIALQSEQWFNEAKVAYAAMRGAWPAERRIKSLREQIVHW